MEPVSLLSNSYWLVKKMPPIALALILMESFSKFSTELDVHALARITGACMGGAATWFWRTELVRGRRVACLMFGWCAGVGFSPVFDWLLITRLVGLTGTPALTFGSAFFVGIVCVRLFEQLADNPWGLMNRLMRIARRLSTKDTPDE